MKITVSQLLTRKCSILIELNNLCFGLDTLVKPLTPKNILLDIFISVLYLPPNIAGSNVYTTWQQDNIDDAR